MLIFHVRRSWSNVCVNKKYLCNGVVNKKKIYINKNTFSLLVFYKLTEEIVREPKYKKRYSSQSYFKLKYVFKLS